MKGNKNNKKNLETKILASITGFKGRVENLKLAEQKRELIR